MNESKRFSLNKKDVQKILTGAMIAMGGALLTYFAESLKDVDFGQWTPVVTALASIAINAGRQYLSEK